MIRQRNRHIFLMISLAAFFYLFCFGHAPARAQTDPLIKYIAESVRLHRVAREQKYHTRLKELNQRIQQEISRGNITAVLNRIENDGLENEILESFFTIISYRKSHNDKIKKRLAQKEFQDKKEKKRAENAYRLLIVDLVPQDMKKWVYLYPIIMPFANYIHPGSIKISDINKQWFKKEKNFKYCFFYLYRKFANLGATGKKYNLLCKKVSIPIKNGPAKLKKFFSDKMGFKFFAQKFDTGVFNRKSKFFAFNGYIYKYLKDEHVATEDQSQLIKTFKTYCAYKAYCNDCDMVKFYNERKLGMLHDLTLEMQYYLEYNTDTFDNYIKMLYYLSRTFPNLSPFLLTYKHEKYKFTSHKEGSYAFKKLKTIWEKVAAKEKNPEKLLRMLQYTLGSMYLLPQKELIIAEEDYSFDRSGYATFMQVYIAIYQKHLPSSP